MRRVCCMLIVFSGLSPGVAAAQSTVPQDLSITGQLVGRDGANVRLARFTITNHGPGALDGVSVRAFVAAGETVVRSAPPGCVEMQFVGHQCDLGTHLEQGEARTLDFVFEYVGTALQARGARGDLSLGNTGPVSDANFANNSASVDLDREFAPPAIHIDLLGADGGRHGATTLSQFAIRNTGGTRLTDIRVASDRCPESAQENLSGQTTLEMANGLVITCSWRLPPHVKGDQRITETVTVTAKAPGDRVVTATATNTIGFMERRRGCGSFRARGLLYSVRSTAADFTCAATRRVLKRCLTRRVRPKGFRCQVSAKGAIVYVWKPKRLPNDRMIAVGRRSTS